MGGSSLEREHMDCKLDCEPRLDYLLSLALGAGATEAGYISVEDLEFNPAIRDICAGNSCGMYGRTWACPPAVGSLDDCRERCSKFNTMMLFSKVFELEDSYDFEGMAQALRDFEITADEVQQALAPEVGECLVLSNEGCGRCASCTFPDNTCRFPDLLHHSIEGYGFNVTRLAKQAGMTYSYGPGSVVFFGAALF